MIIKLKKFFVIALALMSVITLSIFPVSAANDDLTVEEVISKYSINYDKAVYPYVVLIRNTDSNSENYFLHISSAPNSVYVKNGFLYCDNGILYNCFLSNNSPYFNSFNCSSSTSIQNLSNSYILSSDYDIFYDLSNEVFFQKTTLLNHLLNLVPQGVGEKITTDLATLTICGVACLALLIGLALLPKVFYKFL